MSKTQIAEQVFVDHADGMIVLTQESDGDIRQRIILNDMAVRNLGQFLINTSKTIKPSFMDTVENVEYGIK